MSSDGPTHVLVVDDSAASRYATVRVLRASGFRVSEASTGAETLAVVERERPDAVILDINLPDMDGYEICRRIRGSAATARTPIVHLSATFVQDHDRARGLDAGADGYLTHPVDPVVLIATLNSVLRTRRAEDDLRDSERRFRTLFDRAVSGICTLDPALAFIDVNAALCAMLGRTREELIGTPSPVAPPENAHLGVAGALEREGAWSGVVTFTRPDGRRIDLEWMVSIHSAPLVRLAIVTDVTQRRLAEEERERILASERTARSEAERANRMKDEFLAMLSHELRTPLNAIVGWSQVLRSPKASAADVTEGLAVIERNARVQAQLISDLLDVSRIISGKMSLDVEDVDAAQVVRASLDAIQGDAAAKGVRLDVSLASDAGHVRGDPRRLQQVVWNIVSNAIKFSARGGEVRVRLGADDGWVRLVVDDDGAGISPEFLPHVFDRFRQQDGGTTRSHGGLGLGLAIVRRVVDMHGGTVTVESAGAGRGATFVVRLPASPPGAASETPAARQRTAAWRRAQVDLADVRVLVVDDDADARGLVARVLSENGATVEDAADVPSAIAAVARFRPHVLVSDIGLPGHGGLVLIRTLREAGHDAKALPAVALTAYATSEDRQRSLDAGYQRHLTKPVDTAALRRAIAEVTGRA